MDQEFGDEDVNSLPLRSELSLRSHKLAESHGYLTEYTNGRAPGVIFGRDEHGRHGNFHPASFEAICANPAWACRLEKVHTSSRRFRLRSNWRWRELDSSNSSDALLMNIFCHPQVLSCVNVKNILGIESDAEVQFGFKPRIPLQSGRTDNTEVDLRLGDLLIEAKLTEANFQFARPALVERYRDFDSVFSLPDLPLRNGQFCCYQLIRGVLAAHAGACSFGVLCDARRPDLIEAWYRIMRAVQSSTLRCQLKIITWQELAIVLPPDLQEFLEGKYGIVPK